MQLPSIILRPISTPGSAPAAPAPLKLQPKSASHDSDKAAKATSVISLFKEWVNTLPDLDLTILSHGSLLSIPHEDTIQSFAVVFPAKSLPAVSSQQEEGKSQPEPETFSILTKAQLSQLKVEVGQPQGVSHIYKK